MSIRIVAAAAAALTFAAAQSAAAQTAQPAGVRSPSPVGFFGAAYLNGAGIDSEESADASGEHESGGGLSLQAGYAFTNKLAVFIDLSGAGIDSEALDDTYSLGHFDIGARYHFASAARAWMPFVEAAIGVRAVKWADVSIDGMTSGDLEAAGSSFSIGGGTHYFLKPSLGLSANLRLTTGTFDAWKFDGEDVDDAPEVDATTSRLNLGVVWLPGSRK